MARIIALLSLIAPAIATMHRNGGGDQKWESHDSMSVKMPEKGSGGYDYNYGGEPKGEDMEDVHVEQGMVHEVVVGGDAGLVYVPDTIQAKVGDKVNFTFMSKNHTVTQSTFADPCMKMPEGMDSGFIPNPDNTVDPAPTVMYEVTTDKPTWMYCAQGPHCSKGMVFSINPTEEKSHAMFKEKAMMSDGGDKENTPPPPPPAHTQSAPPSGESSCSYVSNGKGTTGSGDACSCSCLCGASSFPEGAGIGSWGGIGGTVPMVPAGKRAVEF